MKKPVVHFNGFLGPICNTPIYSMIQYNSTADPKEVTCKKCLKSIEVNERKMKCPKCGAPEYDLDYEYNFLGDTRNWSCWECEHEWTEDISQNQSKSEGE